MAASFEQDEKDDATRRSATGVPIRIAAMSHKHAHLLRTVFQDPISGNIHWREVESLLLHLGAEVEATRSGSFRVALNRVEVFLHHPHHSSVCDKSTIKLLREFLAHAGVTLSTYEAKKG